MKLIPIILSGGAGTRLWPLSWGDHPKQFLPLVTERTMIQETLLRLKGLELGTPIIGCGEAHRFLVAQQVGEVMGEIALREPQGPQSSQRPQILLEPMAKNTAPAIAAACRAAMGQDEEAVVIVLPSDHVIADVGTFQKAVMEAAQKAAQGYLVTFGIVPTFAATGYGYVKGGPSRASGTPDVVSGTTDVVPGTTVGGGALREPQGPREDVMPLERFVEKPDLQTAQKYLDSGEYYWNSGMFVFKAKTFLEELASFEPQMAELSVQSYEKAKVENDFTWLDKGCFEQIKGNSIDYAVMEKTKKGMIVKLNAGWDDVGSWTALYDISKKDGNQNVINGDDVITFDTTGSYIRGGKRTIATIGLDNVVIVDSEDGLLVAAKDKIQDVKKVAEEIKGRG
ncbi:MAG: mannose-1-phosphate guanylyltransferase/mannose-6-phosphate isomerase [Treponema sp.]|nr:mannose-1-phosphate guanylyltransferase/mannose-6-phosphate isomerase [Treponema sp.]